MKSTQQQRDEFYDSGDWYQFRREYWRQVFESTWGDPILYCTYCDTLLNYGCEDNGPALDHIFPLHSHWEWRLEPKNITLCCKKCNRMKGGMDPRKYPIRNILIRKKILLNR